MNSPLYTVRDELTPYRGIPYPAVLINCGKWRVSRNAKKISHILIVGNGGGGVVLTLRDSI